MMSPADPNVIDTLEMGEPELEEIQDLPPLSSYVMGCRFWWKAAMFPLFFVLLNEVVFISLIMMDDYESEYQFSEDIVTEINSRTSVQSMTKWNLLVVAVMLFIDSFVLYGSAVFMDKEVGLLEAREVENKANSTSTSTPSMHNVHAQASLRMDMFLSRGRRRPDVSLFVNLLYLATVLAMATSLVCLALRVFVGTSKAAGMCFGRHGHEQADSTTPSVDGVPDDLQEWVSKWVSNADRYWYNQAPLTYAHMVDGTTYFVGRNSSSTTVTDNDDDDSIFHENIPTLLATGPDGSIRHFSGIFAPKWLTIVEGESELASEAFCCYYSPSASRSEYMGQATTTFRVLCASASEDCSHGFRNVSLILADRKRDAHPFSMKAHNGELWVLVRVLLENRRFQEFTFKQSIEIYKLQPKTMQVSSIANITLNNEHENLFPFESTATCFRWAVTIGSVVGATVLAPASFWMLKVRKMPAGVAPICFGLIALISLLSEDLAEGMAFLMVVALTIYLLGSASGRDVPVWALYSTLAALLAINVGKAGSIGAMILFVIVGLVLDHPVLQFVGWLGGIVTLLIGAFSFFKKHGQFENLVVIPIGIVVSCGLVSMGYTLTRYRTYLVYNTKRLWTLMRTSRENVAGRQQDGDGMMQGLLN